MSKLYEASRCLGLLADVKPAEYLYSYNITRAAAEAGLTTDDPDCVALVAAFQASEALRGHRGLPHLTEAAALVLARRHGAAMREVEKVVLALKHRVQQLMEDLSETA